MMRVGERKQISASSKNGDRSSHFECPGSIVSVKDRVLKVVNSRII